jgi:HTH-type transcriptional regulator, sugar sensing transcriptional regulator
MHDAIRIELEKWGLPAPEAQAYLALIRSGALNARSIANAIGIPRTSVYPILESLVQKGLVEADVGVGSRYSAVHPKEALPSLMVREREELLQRDSLTTSLIKQLDSLAHPAGNNGESELIEVLRDPRVVATRFERLQREAKRTVEAFVKAPILNPSYSNPTQTKGLKRGLRYRGLYERAILDSPEIKPYLLKWIAEGEQVRIYEGELPHKLAIFDRQNILIPLITSNGQGRTLFIRHPQLAMSLGMFFDFLWQRAEPLGCEDRKSKPRTSRIRVARKNLPALPPRVISRNNKSG